MTLELAQLFRNCCVHTLELSMHYVANLAYNKGWLCAGPMGKDRRQSNRDAGKYNNNCLYYECKQCSIEVSSTLIITLLSCLLLKLEQLLQLFQLGSH